MDQKIMEWGMLLLLSYDIRIYKQGDVFLGF